MPEQGIEVLFEPIMAQIAQQKAAGNSPDAVLMSTATLKEVVGRVEGGKLDIIGVPIILNEDIPFGKIGLSIEVPEENMKQTLEGLKNGI